MACSLWKILILAVAFFGLVASQSPSSGDVDLHDLVAEILNMPTEMTPATSSERTTTTDKRTVCPKETSLCVPYHLCGNGTFTEQELDLNDPTNPCHYLTTCCPFTDIHEERITIPPTNDEPTQLPEMPLRPSTPKPTAAPSTGKPPVTINKCGIRNKDGLTYRITNALDHEAEYAEFPWMMAIFGETDVLGVKSNVFRCGGSLIHPRVVLTAAHCFQKKGTPLVARAGEWDTQTTNEIYPHQDRKVVEVVLHEGFHKGGLFNDIALLILETPIDRADNIGFACLPKAGANFDSIQCTATGWGTHTLGGNEQTILKKVELPIVPRASCQETFRKLRKTQSYELHESYLCAGGFEGKDTCKGDGGSPLVCPTMLVLDQYVQAGVVSWGRGCGADQIPGIYADIAVLRDWIDLKMTERNLDTFYYEM